MAELLDVPPRWVTLRAQTPEGNPVVMLIDEAVALTAPYVGFGLLVGVGVQLHEPDPQGQPTQGEKPVLRGFEQGLVDSMGGAARLVASVTVGGVREYLVYARDTDWMEPWRETVPEPMTSHSFGVQVAEDEGWHGLRELCGLEPPPA